MPLDGLSSGLAFSPDFLSPAFGLSALGASSAFGLSSALGGSSGLAVVPPGGSPSSQIPAPQNGTPEADTLEAVRICVEHGADVNETTRYGRIKVNGDPAEVRSRYLFPPELPTDAPSYGDMRWAGATPLHGAAVRGVNTVVKYLVDHGAKLDAKTTLGWTPLMLADHIFTANVERSWPETAAYLRELMRERGLPADEDRASPDVTAK